MIAGETPRERLVDYLRQSILQGVGTTFVIGLMSSIVIAIAYNIGPDAFGLVFFAVIGLGIGVSQLSLWHSRGKTTEYSPTVEMVVSLLGILYYNSIAFVALMLALSVPAPLNVLAAVLYPIVDIDATQRGFPITLTRIFGAVFALILEATHLIEDTNWKDLDLAGTALRLFGTPRTPR